MPAGLEEMVPLPVPAVVTVNGRIGGVKVTVTLRACDMLTWQLRPDGVHPLHVTVCPLVGAAVSVTEVADA